MIFEFTAPIIYWRGPAPWFYARIPQEQSDDIRHIAPLATYGWGVIPVTVTVQNLSKPDYADSSTTFTTSLFPKDDRYLVPIKAAVRKAEGIEEGDEVAITMEVQI